VNRQSEDFMDWHAMVFLGAYHGINPGMGWLFAVALGMQQASARGVWRALAPIALGHAMAVSAVLLVVGLAQVVVPLDALKVLVASALIALGLYRLWRHRHPHFGGMQVGFRDLTVWSFLMASAHGAGFMVVPFVMPGFPPLSAASHDHASHMASASTNVASTDAMAVAVHTLAYLAVMALAAWVVYRKLGLSLLRKAWFNMDWVWAGALVITGVGVLYSCLAR
jgi:hypothetical protein